MPSSTFDHTGEDAFRARIAGHDVSCPDTGPIDAAVMGALERLADESSQAMRLARADGDKAGGTFWQRAATSYTNALIEYRKGVRPELLASGAWLLPSRRAYEAPHIVRMDGDWVCSCKAGASMHWAVALIIGIEVAHDDMTRFDDGPIEEELPAIEERKAQLGARLCVARATYVNAT